MTFKHLCQRHPLVFLDLETTGVNSRSDRIVEIALVRFVPGQEPQTFQLRLNPQFSIPAAATAVHGIRKEDVERCPTFAQVAEDLGRWFDDADLAGFGVARFDVPFLFAEFDRAGWTFPLQGRKVVDALALFHRLEPRDLAAAVRRYCGCELRQAHQATADAWASAMVLDAMLGRHSDMPRSVEELHDHLVGVDIEGWFRRHGTQVVFGRGKHRHATPEEVARRDPPYLRWLLDRVLPDARGLIEAALQSELLK